jgi:glycosyltransferase involved in cell wall biosynthesis
VGADARGAGLAVDILISNHNYGEYLEDAIESARSQTHPNVKVVVVDDGSTDDSRDRLRRYGDRVEIVLKENGGQASAFNAGMARAHGDLVIFLDSDDVLCQHAAAAVADVFAADPALSRVQFRLAVIDAAGHPTGVTKPTAHLQPPTGDLRREELSFPYDIPWLPSSGSAFSSSAIRRILPIPERDFPRHGADWYTVHLSALLGTAAWIDDVCARYRVHGRNGYELLEPRLSLRWVRDTVAYADATSRALLRLAHELRLEAPDRILSLSDLGNRLISIRLEPERHPIRGDRVGGLLVDAVRAAGRRFDRSAPAKLALLGWFLAVAVSPRPLVRRLGELLLFPEARRPWFNRLLGRMYGTRGGQAA